MVLGKSRRIAFICGMVLVLIVFMHPPWRESVKHTSGSGSEFRGHWLIMEPPSRKIDSPFASVVIDYPLWIMELAGVICASALVTFLLIPRDEKTPRTPPPKDRP